jgi:hypothetical protein
MYFNGWKHIWILVMENQKHLSMTMQFRNIVWLLIYFGQGKNCIITTMDGEA